MTKFHESNELNHRYMLPTLVEECTKYLWRDLYPRNACRAYEFARLFEEPILMEKSIQMICTQTREILSESTFEVGRKGDILDIWNSIIETFG